MTCIVGIVTDGGVWMGADSAAVSDDASHGRAVRHAKLFRNKDFVIGYTTSFRMGQLLENKMRPITHDKELTDYQYITSVFCEDVRELFKVSGYGKVENNVEAGGNFLVAYRGVLYEIQDDYSALVFSDGTDAIGTGEDYALGSLLSSKGKPPAVRVKMALQAAAYFCPSVMPPFKILHVKNDG